MKPKTIKFDLPIGGVKVKTVDELRSHFTTEILDHFRKGTLAQWLRTRNLSAELAAVEELSADAAPERTLLALCEAFAVDADEHSVQAALARATGVAPSSSARIEWLRDGQVFGRLTPRLEAKWIFEVPVPGLVQVTVRASVDVACMLENVRGRQYATDGTVERTEQASLAAIPPRRIHLPRSGRLRRPRRRAGSGLRVPATQHRRGPQPRCQLLLPHVLRPHHQRAQP